MEDLAAVLLVVGGFVALGMAVSRLDRSWADMSVAIRFASVLGIFAMLGLVGSLVRTVG